MSGRRTILAAALAIILGLTALACDHHEPHAWAPIATTTTSTTGAPMVDATAAENAAAAQLATLGNGWECWAEINTEMHDGYEVICNHWSEGDQPQPSTIAQ